MDNSGEYSLSGKAQPKARFSNRMPNGDFLSLSVWAGKSDPAAEVLTVQVRHYSKDQWETIGRLAVYRTAEGLYSQLPERKEKLKDEV